MTTSISNRIWQLNLAFLMGALMLQAATAAEPSWKGLWTDPAGEDLPAEFRIQGEYVGQIEGGAKLGCQVIALGPGAFQAVVYPGGLPGDGWDGENKSLMDGKLDGEQATFAPAEGNKHYLAKPANEFSATKQFPPQGQAPYQATADGQVMIGKTDQDKAFQLQKTIRKSPTLGKQPPSDAVILFDGTNKEQWRGGRLDELTGLLNTDGHDMLTQQKFNNYVMHLEFMLPFRPDARGQGRGNSGFYQVDHYEVQVLDSFGLEGVDNECGGIYKQAHPVVNMCFPPLTWQTYDIEFTNAVRDESGKKVKNAVITLRHNGVMIYENQEVDRPTGGHRGDPEGTPGPIKLQGHGNPLQYRNIWLVEK